VEVKDPALKTLSDKHPLYYRDDRSRSPNPVIRRSGNKSIIFTLARTKTKESFLARYLSSDDVCRRDERRTKNGVGFGENAVVLMAGLLACC
jgi:hypothetical protein